MKNRKPFLYAILGADFLAILLAWAGFLLIEEDTILEVQKYLLFYWDGLYSFLIGYPLDVTILISVTIIIYYILRFFGIRID